MMTSMTAEAPATGMHLGVGFDSGKSRGRNGEAWKNSLGNNSRVPARFELLPEGEKRWDRIGASAIAQLALLTFFVALPIFFPERIAELRYRVTPLEWFQTEIPVAAPPPAPPKVARLKAPEPKPIEEPKLNPKQPHIFVQQKAFQPQVRQLDVKAPEVISTPVFEAKLNAPTNQPKRPKEEVKVNNLNTGSAAPATLKNMPVEKVQTGGFGDPNGLAGKGNPNKGTNINRPRYPAPPGGGKHGRVQSTGFADASAATEAPKKRAAASDSPTSMVEILDKPRPQYTADGRNQRIEGDVVLDMVFLANGSVQVNRVISGLGHGLDEAAVHAAQGMKFKPARRDGQPVDFPARVRIEFRLAY